MVKILLLLLFLFAVGTVIQGVLVYKKFLIARELITKASPFRIESTDHSVSMLVLGDSTAVGVGATKSEDSVAGRLARHTHATYVENLAVSGARTADLSRQIDAASRARYNIILIQIGANDIMRFKSAESSGERLSRALKTLPQHDKLIVLTAGNVGGTKFFPRLINPWYTKLTLQYHKVFGSAVLEVGGLYINLYAEPANDLFITQPLVYFSPDGLHPSSEGYRLWFEKVLDNLIVK